MLRRNRGSKMKQYEYVHVRSSDLLPADDTTLRTTSCLARRTTKSGTRKVSTACAHGRSYADHRPVIYQCGLKRDLTLFTAGDMTEVGEKVPLFALAFFYTWLNNFHTRQGLTLRYVRVLQSITNIANPRPLN